MTMAIDAVGPVRSSGGQVAGASCDYLTQSPTTAYYLPQSTVAANSPSAVSSWLGAVGQAVWDAAGSLGYALAGQHGTFSRRGRNSGWIDEFLDAASLKDGWNGVGSLAPSEASLRAVLQIAMAAEGRGGFTLTPNDSGTISLEWETSGGYALLEVGRSKYSLTIEPSSGSPYFDNGLFSPSVISTLLVRIGAAISGESPGLIDAARIAPTGLMTNVRPTFYVRSA